MEKPILFNTEMVKAILDDRKSSTRRPVKRTPCNDEPCGYGFWKEYNERDNRWYVKDYTHAPVWWTLEEYIDKFSKYHVGDILYVRETWLEHEGKYYFKADTPIDKGLRKEFKWKPSIHMPKVAARIFLKVKDVRIEKLNIITGEQARSEGIIETDDYGAVRKYADLWNSIYFKQGDGWGENPWVWVIEFEKVQK